MSVAKASSQCPILLIREFDQWESLCKTEEKDPCPYLGLGKTQ